MIINHNISPEKQIIYHLILKSASTNDLSLFTGKMGIVVAFHDFLRKNRDDVLYDYQLNLLNQITDNICNLQDLNFSSGLLGIGWGLEYISQSNDYNLGEIKNYIEEKIIAIKINKFQSYINIDEINYLIDYILIRAKNSIINNNCISFEKDYIKEILDYFSFININLVDYTLKFNILELEKIYLGDFNLNYNPDFNKIILEREFCFDIIGLRNGIAGKLVKLIN